LVIEACNGGSPLFSTKPNLKLLLEVWMEKKTEVSQIEAYKLTTHHLMCWTTVAQIFFDHKWSWHKFTQMERARSMDALRTGKRVMNNLKEKDPLHEILLCSAFSFITNIDGLDEQFRDGIRGLYHSIEQCFPEEDERFVLA
jgi:hypothetical protein